MDDVHLDVTACSRLFSLIYNNYSHLRLLYVSRPIRLEQLGSEGDSQFTFTQYMPKVEITADAAMANLANFYSYKNFGQEIPPAICNVFINECTNDLLLLGRYLKEWDGSSKLQVEQLRKKVFRSLHNDLVRMRARSSDAVRVLLVLGLFYRFELAVEREFLEKSLSLNVEYMINSGEVRLDNGYLMLHHSSLAKLYSNVIQAEKMPEFHELLTRYQPMPAALFKHYVAFEPRNFCEFIIGLRRTPHLLKAIIEDTNLSQHIKKGLEREPNINVLGWAMPVLFLANKKAAWNVIDKTDITTSALEKLNKAEADEVWLFILNLSKISQEKGIAGD